MVATLLEQALFSTGLTKDSNFAGINYDEHLNMDGVNCYRKVAMIWVGENPVEDETIVIGTKTYTFKEAISGSDQIACSGDRVETSYNIIARINMDKIDTGCTAYMLDELGVIALVANVIEGEGSEPTITLIPVKMSIEFSWTNFISQNQIVNGSHWKKNPAVDKDIKPVVLAEYNAGTDKNFLY
jgi:hypothetical protein